MNEEIEWICTDPNNKQYGRRLSTYQFEFKERNKAYSIEDKPMFLTDEAEWYRMVIDLEDYTLKEINDYIDSYYDNLDELFKTYGENSCWIIAETIFELETQY